MSDNQGQPAGSAAARRAAVDQQLLAHSRGDANMRRVREGNKIKDETEDEAAEEDTEGE
jgi:hypothetical protein